MPGGLDWVFRHPYVPSARQRLLRRADDPSKFF